MGAGVVLLFNAGVVLFGGDGCWCGAAVQCCEWCRLVEDGVVLFFKKIEEGGWVFFS